MNLMIIPDFSREEELIKKGYKAIAGVDEAGRGPLAGPVAAGAVIFDDDQDLIRELIVLGVRDSKEISEKKREKLYDFIAASARCWAVDIVSEDVIDEINILAATKLAMKNAICKLSCQPDFILIDGNATLSDLPLDQAAVPGADARILSVSAASIMAKVTRDRILCQLDDRYPGYGFAQHKGYGTKSHIEALCKLGPCPVHRKSFEPIKSMFYNREN